MAHRLAFYTMSLLHEPVGHARVQGFIDRAPGVYAAADASIGFHSRSVRDFATYKHSWGEIVIPKCYPPIAPKDQYAATLSLWEDLEAVAAFAYKGAHGEALANKKDWFQSLGVPTYVAWWVAAGHQPTWQEAADRLDHLHAHGASSFAFNMRTPHDAHGDPVKLDHWAMQAKAKQNAAKA